MAKTGQPSTSTDPAAGLGCATDTQGAGDPDLDVATGLVQLTALVQGVYARVSERHDLTPVQAKLLCVLLGGPRGMADLAQCFGVEKAALTGLMDRAERRGLAQRSSVPGDRRALQATLTDAGHQAATAFYAEVSAELSRLIAPLTDSDRERFRSTMAEIIARCRTSPSASDRCVS
ncbi:MarR family winged helix-turn-helix transcriptional regulator [Acrocarpospora macrocephala]|nr:MarR family transcriptional regulator [Acrocarpospora macrocephala]